MHDPYLDLLVLLAGSLLMPMFASRTGVPATVLLILFGMAVGPYGLGLISPGLIIDFLFELGFIILMFLAGMEIDFNGIRHRGSRIIAEMVLVGLAIFCMAFLIAFLLGMPPLFGLVLGATSVGLPLAVLKETGRLRSPIGQTIILLCSLGEFLSVIGITLFYFVSKFGLSTDLLIALARLGAVLIGSVLLLRLVMALAWWRPARFAKLVEEREDSEIGVRAALLIMMFFSIMAILAGLESIVGAFVAGALLAFVLRGKEVLEKKLAAVGHGLFVPIVFAVVGIRFDPNFISAESLLLTGKLLLAAFGARLLPNLLLLRHGLSIPAMLGIASLLSAPLTLVVAIAAICGELYLLDERGQNVLILLAISSGLVFPVFFRIFFKYADKQGNRMTFSEV